MFCTSASLPSHIRNKLLFNLHSCGNCSLFPGTSVKQSKPRSICTALWIAESPALCALETDSFSLCLEICDSPIASLPRKSAHLLHFWLSSVQSQPLNLMNVHVAYGEGLFESHLSIVKNYKYGKKYSPRTIHVSSSGLTDPLLVMLRYFFYGHPLQKCWR